MKRFMRAGLVWCTAVFTAALYSQEALPGAVETGSTMATEVPEGLEEKPPLSDYDLSKKKEGYRDCMVCEFDKIKVGSIFCSNCGAHLEKR